MFKLFSISLIISVYAPLRQNVVQQNTSSTTRPSKRTNTADKTATATTSTLASRQNVIWDSEMMRNIIASRLAYKDSVDTESHDSNASGGFQVSARHNSPKLPSISTISFAEQRSTESKRYMDPSTSGSPFSPRLSLFQSVIEMHNRNGLYDRNNKRVSQIHQNSNISSITQNNETKKTNVPTVLRHSTRPRSQSTAVSASTLFGKYLSPPKTKTKTKSPPKLLPKPHKGTVETTHGTRHTEGTTLRRHDPIIGNGSSSYPKTSFLSRPPRTILEIMKKYHKTPHSTAVLSTAVLSPEPEYVVGLPFQSSTLLSTPTNQSIYPKTNVTNRVSKLSTSSPKRTQSATLLRAKAMLEASKDRRKKQDISSKKSTAVLTFSNILDQTKSNSKAHNHRYISNHSKTQERSRQSYINV